ncbi:hypothetical protein AAEX28_02380 [Lentisphaerota bacterium WC36G]|nr:hypothetical protein LJT99_05265 [Lentisphaerae bacterium WC36]
MNRAIFSNLTEQFLSISLQSRKVIKVKLLPAKLFDNYIEIILKVKENPTPQNIVEGRKELRKLILNVFPRRYKNELNRFDYAMLSSIAMKLFVGATQSNNIQAKASKKASNENDFNFEFAVCKVLKTFSFQLEDILNYSIPQIMTLFSNSIKIGQFEAYNDLFMAMASAQYGGEILTQLQNNNSNILFNDASVRSKASYTEEELNEANERLEKFLQQQKEKKDLKKKE